MAGMEEAKQFQAAQEAVMGEMEKTLVRPRLKQSFICQAQCCDQKTDSAGLQQCLVQCQTGVHRTQQVMQSHLQAFQQRVQNCMQRCQDRAQESLPRDPSDADIRKAEDSMGHCVGSCAKEYRSKLGKLKNDIAADV